MTINVLLKTCSNVDQHSNVEIRKGWNVIYKGKAFDIPVDVLSQEIGFFVVENDSDLYIVLCPEDDED